MKILGISGIAGSVPFKRAHWPGLEERLYRISQGLDSAAALVVDGEIVAAAAEERFSRNKHCGDFPIGAIQYCLSEGGLSPGDLDALVHGFDYSRYEIIFRGTELGAQEYREVYSKQALLELVEKRLAGFPTDRVHQVEHHLAHAASTYFTSGWDECLVVVVDAMGEALGASIFHGKDGRLRRVGQISSHDSIGILYSTVTLHLGFDFNADEYKIMGLAPYGDATRYREFFEEAVELRPNGTIRIPILHLNETREEQENYVATRRHLGENLIPERRPEDEITQDHRDVAASLQVCLDRTMLHLCGHWGQKLGQRRLAMAGGVALNCTANGKLLNSGLFDEIYVQPAAGDDGIAIGAALQHASQSGALINRRCPVPFFGPAFGEPDIEAALAEFAPLIETRRFASYDETCAEAARLIAEGRVLAWYRGRMEFGPRALGNRSILADPGHPEMRDRINAMVKKREAFRPFAPAVTLEQVDKWFDVRSGLEFPYMTVIVDVREEHRAALPAITHVDGTARVQTASRTGNPDFHTLLEHVGRATGREMLLNTSFNVKGQPIVNTPREAVETFLGTGMDHLFLGEHLVRRRT